MVKESRHRAWTSEAADQGGEPWGFRPRRPVYCWCAQREAMLGCGLLRESGQVNRPGFKPGLRFLLAL